MSRSFEEYQRALMPAGMAGPYGLAWATARGATKDALALEAKEAVKARLVDIAPPDALPRLGADRGIARAPGEGFDSWRARIAGAWESWSWLGTRYGIGYAVGLLGLGTPALWSWHDLPWDADASRWARVLVVFRGLPAWDAGAVWDGDDTWDSTRSPDPAETADPATARPQLRQILRQWINARDIVETVLIAEGGLLWDLDALWDGDDAWDAGDGETVWSAPAWDTDETGAVWDAPTMAWDAFC